MKTALASTPLSGVMTRHGISLPCSLDGIEIFRPRSSTMGCGKTVSPFARIALYFAAPTSYHLGSFFMVSMRYSLRFLTSSLAASGWNFETLMVKSLWSVMVSAMFMKSRTGPTAMEGNTTCRLWTESCDCTPVIRRMGLPYIRKTVRIFTMDLLDRHLWRRPNVVSGRDYDTLSDI